MIAVDTNVLVAYQRSEYVYHTVEVITILAEGHSAWGLPWPCAHEFLAVVTNPRIFRIPTPMADAIDCLSALLESPSVRGLAESGMYWNILSALLGGSGGIGARVHDARVAAICLDHDVRELWTADRDFSRFPNLKCRNPLVGAMPF